MAKNRLIGEYPAIGIRPTIDGRRGVMKVRESLEEQTMNMAKSVKALYEKRMPLYRRFADIEIDGNGTIEEVADRIIKEINAL